MADELKPCPFCGTTEMLRRVGTRWGFVRCGCCGADGLIPDNFPGGWNRRTPVLIPRADAERAALEAKTEIAALLGITCSRDTATGEPIMWGDADGDCLSPEVAVQCALEKIKRDAELAVAEVERLREERDKFEAALGRACLVGGTTYLVERAEKAEAERDAAQAREAGLREALRPFAEIGIGENPDYQPLIRMDREAIVAARAALDEDAPK